MNSLKALLVRVRISPRILADLEIRSPDDDGCWRGVHEPGIYWLSRQQAKEILGDCEFQGNVGGNYIDPVSPGLTRAYRALHNQLQGTLK